RPVDRRDAKALFEQAVSSGAPELGSRKEVSQSRMAGSQIDRTRSKPQITQTGLVARSSGAGLWRGSGAGVGQWIWRVFPPPGLLIFCSKRTLLLPSSSPVEFSDSCRASQPALRTLAPAPSTPAHRHS